MTFTKEEWFAAVREIFPDLTQPEFDQMWSDFSRAMAGRDYMRRHSPPMREDHEQLPAR